MRIVIDLDFCQGHGVCMGEAPEVFEVGDDNKVKLIDPTPPDGLREKVELAAQYCPTSAIKVEDS